jgi:hypothetical protein
MVGPPHTLTRKRSARKQARAASLSPISSWHRSWRRRICAGMTISSTNGITLQDLVIWDRGFLHVAMASAHSWQNMMVQIARNSGTLRLHLKYEIHAPSGWRFCRAQMWVQCCSDCFYKMAYDRNTNLIRYFFKLDERSTKRVHLSPSLE